MGEQVREREDKPQGTGPQKSSPEGIGEGVAVGKNRAERGHMGWG